MVLFRNPVSLANQLLLSVRESAKVTVDALNVEYFPVCDGSEDCKGGMDETHCAQLQDICGTHGY